MGNSKSVLPLTFVEGTTILEMLSEMREKAIKFEVAYTSTTINGIQVFVSQNAKINESFEKYHRAVSEKNVYVVC